MKTAFIQELIEQARKRPELFLIVSDMGYSVVEPFFEAFPDRYLNVGIAEQNMASIAAGLASEGYHVFTYSNTPFRCLEQIRNDIAYPGHPVTSVSVGGVAQDYAIMRCLPGMTIAAPGDPLETRAVVRWLCEHPGPSYLRLWKAGGPVFHATLPAVEPGRSLPVLPPVENPRGLFLTTGAALSYAMEAASSPELQGAWAVHSLPIWSETVKPAVAETLAALPIPVISIEDHLTAGGFGSYLRETLTDQASLKTISGATADLTPAKLVEAALSSL